jgi:putative acetyltransferase
LNDLLGIMMESPVIVVEPFRPADQAQVKSLVLAGLVEHWGVLDPTKNPDLEDIACSYSGATFLVARHGAEIVGAGALVPRGEEQAEIVRMSVASGARRLGIGRRILQALCRAAVKQGVRKVVLETTETWDEVIAFYMDYGFRITHHKDGDIYFSLDLEAQPQLETTA